MIEPNHDVSALRAGLIEAIRVSRAAEREIFAAVGPVERDEPAADGGWSPKDIQAHLSAWRQRQTDRLVALREGRDEPVFAATETDEINAIFHAERADWPWERVETDADATAEALIAEIDAAAPETIGGDRFAGSIMGNGSEHTLTHLPPVAARVGMGSRLLDLAAAIESILDRADWPSRPAAFARYNLACFFALGGRLDEARSLLRQALPEQEDLRTYAPLDDDLVALRDEIPSLGAGD
jgi:hypothetical protein